MTLSVFQQMALDAIADIHGRTGFPCSSAAPPSMSTPSSKGWGIPQVPPNPSLRLELEREAGRDGVAALHERLRLVDPDAAGKNRAQLAADRAGA